MTTLACSNCSSMFDSALGGLVITHAQSYAACICPGCVEDALVVKLVLRRVKSTAVFTYEQYTALEMVKNAKKVGV